MPRVSESVRGGRLHGFRDQFATYLRYTAAIDRDFHKSLEALMALPRHRFKYLSAKPPVLPQPETTHPLPAAQEATADQQQTSAPAQHAQVSENGIRSVLRRGSVGPAEPLKEVGTPADPLASPR